MDQHPCGMLLKSMPLEFRLFWGQKGLQLNISKVYTAVNDNVFSVNLPGKIRITFVKKMIHSAYIYIPSWGLVALKGSEALFLAPVFPESAEAQAQGSIAWDSSEWTSWLGSEQDREWFLLGQAGRGQITDWYWGLIWSCAGLTDEVRLIKNMPDKRFLWPWLVSMSCLSLFVCPVLSLSVWMSVCVSRSVTHTHTPQEAAEGRMAHNNGWNRANGMATMRLMYLMPFHLFPSSHYHEPVLPNQGATNLLCWLQDWTVVQVLQN